MDYTFVSETDILLNSGYRTVRFRHALPASLPAETGHLRFAAAAAGLTLIKEAKALAKLLDPGVFTSPSVKVPMDKSIPRDTVLVAHEILETLLREVRARQNERKAYHKLENWAAAENFLFVARDLPKYLPGRTPEQLHTAMLYLKTHAFIREHRSRLFYQMTPKGLKTMGFQAGTLMTDYSGLDLNPIPDPQAYILKRLWQTAQVQETQPSESLTRFLRHEVQPGRMGLPTAAGPCAYFIMLAPYETVAVGTGRAPFQLAYFRDAMVQQGLLSPVVAEEGPQWEALMKCPWSQRHAPLIGWRILPKGLALLLGKRGN